jgi:hypothetical protein
MLICDFKNGQYITEEFYYHEAEVNLQKKK